MYVNDEETKSKVISGRLSTIPCWIYSTETRRRSESAYIRQVHNNAMMYTSTRLHTRLPSNVRAQ